MKSYWYNCFFIATIVIAVASCSSSRKAAKNKEQEPTLKFSIQVGEMTQNRVYVTVKNMNPSKTITINNPFSVNNTFIDLYDESGNDLINNKVHLVPDTTHITLGPLEGKSDFLKGLELYYSDLNNQKVAKIKATYVYNNSNALDDSISTIGMRINY